MAYSGMPTDTSVAFMERTMQMKIHVRQSFFVGEGKWFLYFAKKKIQSEPREMESQIKIRKIDSTYAWNKLQLNVALEIFAT